LHFFEAGLGQRLDEAHLVGGGDRPLLDLEALARAFLVDVDGFRHIGHDSCSRRSAPAWPTIISRGAARP
jgi:hypothetical protein